LGFLILVFRNPAVLLIEDYWGEGAYQLKQLTKKKPKSKLKVPSYLYRFLYCDRASWCLCALRVGERSLANREQSVKRDVSL